ncbi:hypothetical protein EBU94_04040 [bacterium]|nr:hypothetical protein [bacterium]
MKRIKSLSQFLLNESVISLSSNFRTLLKRMWDEYDNRLAEEILKMDNQDFDFMCNYIDITGDDHVTFTPDKKVKDVPTGYEFKKIRQPMKIGRFVRSIMKSRGLPFTDKEVEDFVNIYKSNIEKEINFKLVKGPEIVKWYYYGNYETMINTLGNSCMKGKADEFFDIYCKNPNQVSMLILMGRKDQDKIRGRALVWKVYDDDGVEYTFMDRIYYTHESDTILFHKYAEANDWAFKLNLDSLEYTKFYYKGHITYGKDLYCNLDEVDFDLYPYIDTMKFLNDQNILTNSGSTGDKKFDNLDGSYDIVCNTCEGKGTITCGYCEGDGTLPCSECNGSGYLSCGECGGDHRTDCFHCVGEGSLECSKCDGEGEIDGEECDKCEGEGRLECGDCDGSGTIVCAYCNRDGDVTCYECGGEDPQCYHCDGAGTIECPDCH